MKKFKNIRLMLLGLLAMGSMNAFAQTYKTDGKFWYDVDEANRTAIFVGVSTTVATTDEIVKNLEIPAEAPLQDDNMNTVTYKVTGAKNGWNKGNVYAAKTRDVTNLVKSLTFAFRVDWDGPIDFVTADKYVAAQSFPNLEALVIKNAHKANALPVLSTIANLAGLKVVDFSGVTNDGALINVPADFVKNMTKLTSVKLPATEPLNIGGFAFEGIQGTDDKGNPTEVKDIDISKATKIWDCAFHNAYVTTVEIGKDVIFIGTSAFAGDGGKEYLTKVTWNSNEIIGGDPAKPWIPAVFDGQVNLKEVVVNADKVVYIAPNAFTDAAPKNDKGEAIPFKLDLSKASALKTVAGALPNIPYGKVLLMGTALAGNDLSTILGFNLDPKSKGTLTELTLPAGLTALADNQFNGFEVLQKIGINMAEIPASAFAGCKELATLTLGENVQKIKAHAFDGTKITNIKIPAGVQEIGDYAFANIKAKEASGIWSAVTLDLSEAESLASIGEGTFMDTNISKADFKTKTTVTVIPVKAFAKSTNFYGKKDENFLTEVALKEGSASKKASIGAYAFAQNPKLATLTGLNHENYEFDADYTKGKHGIDEYAFAGTALDKVELDATPITVIATGAFSDMEKLSVVKLNEQTAVIKPYAFNNDIALATVTGLNQDKLTEIGTSAFRGFAMETLDLSGATALTTIGDYAFAQYVENLGSSNEEIKDKLKLVKFPAETKVADAIKDNKADKFTNKISSLGQSVFFAARNLTDIENLKDTKITTLPQMFSATTSTTADDIKYCPATLTSIELPAEPIVSENGTTLYKGLLKIDDYALQGLGMESIVIPSTVTTFGACVLQGCLSLKKVEWYDALVLSLDKYTFRGNTNLEEFYYMTASAPGVPGVIASGGITDNHFYWCSKEKLTVYVNSESLLQLRADGYTTANAKYSKLNDELEDEITLTALNEADNMYYRTYYNKDYATWFDASAVKVYTASVEGSKVVMTEAKTENGYYKIEQFDPTATPGNKGAADRAVCIIKSADPKVKVEYYALPANNITTLAKGNELKVTMSEKTASAIHFYFKLGKGPKGIGFYRITKGTFKAGAVYIEAPDPARDFLPIAGEETAIKAIEQMVEDDAPVYNLQGVQVKTAQKGMFIKNGKKFIVK